MAQYLLQQLSFLDPAWIKRKDFQQVAQIVKQRHPNAFYTAEEVKSIHTPPFPLHAPGRAGGPLLRFVPRLRRLPRTAP